jgi:hypothetical protein
MPMVCYAVANAADGVLECGPCVPVIGKYFVGNQKRLANREASMWIAGN